MKFLSIVGNSFGCSASGERLVSAARDGDFQEAKALLECNPRLARYSTFGVRNSPLHYSAAQGHHEVFFRIEFALPLCFFLRNSHDPRVAWRISYNGASCFFCLLWFFQIVSLLLESGVDINLRNYRGQVC